MVMSPIWDPLLVGPGEAVVVGEKKAAVMTDRLFAAHRLRNHIDAHRVRRAVQSGGWENENRTLAVMDSLGVQTSLG